MTGGQSLNWAIIVVNWNNWPDTLECLEGILRMEDCDARIILVDNASTDDSVDRFMQWANGYLSILPESDDPSVSSLVVNPILKPLRVAMVDSTQQFQPNDFFGQYDIYLIKSKFNQGFAAGNNIGIKFSQSFLGCNIFWLLNNDAIPQKDAFKCLKSIHNTPNAPSICGTAILDYHNPNKVQSCGGLFNFFTGMASHKFDGCAIDFLNQQSELIFSTYPVGASLIVHEDFIFSSGYMNEELFLYYEELDWMIKKSSPIQCPISTRSRIFHKGSSSTGFSQHLRDRNASADYYIIRNRLLIARQIGIIKLIIFGAVTMVGLFKRLLSGRPELFYGGVMAMFDGLRGRGGKR